MTYQNSREKGQSLVEFALVLVFLLSLLAGIFDLGRAFFAYIIIRDAAQEGAVFGSIAPKSDLTGFEVAVIDRVGGIPGSCRSFSHSDRCNQNERAG